jgi:glucose/arabinose dehydrogenase
MRRRLRSLAVTGLAALAAFALAVGLFWERPASFRLQRIYDRAMADRFPNRDWYGYGPRAFAAAEWDGVGSPASPQWKVRRGLEVELVARGFTYPVNLAFAADSSDDATDPEAPLLYVNELHGTIRYVTRGRAIRTYATGLTNFKPITSHARSDETGLTGLLKLPGSDDLVISGSYQDEKSGLLKNHVLYLESEPGGRTLKRARVLLDIDEVTSPSNQIQAVRLGPDGKLYVSVGDAENYLLSLDLDRFGGKILRLNLDGSACPDNPFFDPARPAAARSYVFAYGLRNAFGVDVDPASGALYAADNGKHIDRLVRVTAGSSFGWNGDPDSTRANALYTWGPDGNTAPVGVVLLARDTLGKGTAGRLYVGEYGPSAAVGRNHAKAILEVALSPRTGLLERIPEHAVQYVGTRRTTVLGLAEGPDGLYFSDFFGETQEVFAEGSGAVWRVFPSEVTRSLPSLDDPAEANVAPPARGRALFFRHCAPCHKIGGEGGAEGPELTHAFTNLDLRLNSRAYEAANAELLALEGEFWVAQRPSLRAVLAARGNERIDLWIRHHLVEPRFDNPRARMPSFAQLGAAEREDLLAFLRTRK